MELEGGLYSGGIWAYNWGEGDISASVFAI